MKRTPFILTLLAAGELACSSPRPELDVEPVYIGNNVYRVAADLDLGVICYEHRGVREDGFSCVRIFPAGSLQRDARLHAE